MGTLAGTADLPEPFEVALGPNQTGHVKLKADLLWTARPCAEGYWGMERTVPSGDVDGGLTLSLFPTGEVELPISKPKMGEAPKRVEIQFKSHREGAQIPAGPEGMAACTLEKAVARCSLPIGRFDLRVSVPPWAPSYRFDIRISQGTVASLKPVRLVRGASISGYVLTESGEPAPKGTQVELALPNSDRTILEPSLDLVHQEAQTDDRGFFQFLGVRPGHYGIRARADGYAPVGAEPIEAQPDLESRLKEPLVLARPITLSLRVLPSSDPWGEAWTVNLSPLSPSGDSLGSVTTQVRSDGTVTKRGLSPGRYRLAILGSENTRWVDQEIELLEGKDPMLVQIPLIRINGTVTKGDEPAPGRLWFGTTHGARRIVVQVEESGDFSGYLPKAGSWPVDWIPKGRHQVQVALEPVQVPDRSSVSLSIEVPDVELHGQVVDERDTPVSGARVRLFSEDEELQTSSLATDDEGEFSLPGIRPGQYGVQASHGKASSEMILATLSEGRDSPDLHLVLRDTVQLSAHVSAGGRPVPGARVTAWPDLGSSPGVSFLDAVTDPDGFFAVEVPGDPNVLNILVKARGFGIQMERVAVGPGQIAEIELDPYPGTLIVAGDLHRAGSAFVVHGGSFLPLLGLVRIAGLDPRQALGGGSLVFPGLEPGLYLVCEGQQVLSGLRTGGEGPASVCTSGLVPPLGDVRVELPAQAAAHGNAKR